MTATGPAHQKAAVESVHFPLWRYNPAAEGKKLTLDSTDKSDTVSFAYPPLVGGSRSARTHPKRKRGRANAVSKELGENRAGPCGRLRRCFATFPSKQGFLGASQAARQEDRPGQGDGDAQGRRGRLQGELRPPQEALRDVRLGHRKKVRRQSRRRTRFSFHGTDKEI